MIALLTEANARVATGHLVETIELSKKLSSLDKEVVVFVNSGAPKGLTERIHCECIFYSDTDCFPASEIGLYLSELDPEIVVTDLRELQNSDLTKLRNYFNGRIICIDEWGHRRLDADIIINPMVNPFYWEYEIGYGELYCGSQYLVLPEELHNYRTLNKQKELQDKIHRIGISMGGVDLKGTSLKLARWLGDYKGIDEISIVVGAGFVYIDQLQDIVKLIRNERVYVNVSNIYDLFLKSDVFFCAGGNTLHELASIGIPAIVIPTAPHEEKNGRQFETDGFGKCLPIADDVCSADVMTALDELENREVRELMRASGISRYDGNGLKRTVDIILRGQV